MLAQAARGATERPLVWARWGLLGYALLAALLLTWLAPWLVGLLFGADYEPAVGVLRVLAWGIVPYVFHLRYSVELVVRGREKAVLVVTAVALGVTAVVASWGFTEMGLLGLAAVLVVGEGVLAVGLRVIKFYA